MTSPVLSLLAPVVLFEDLSVYYVPRAVGDALPSGSVRPLPARQLYINSHPSHVLSKEPHTTRRQGVPLNNFITSSLPTGHRPSSKLITTNQPLHHPPGRGRDLLRGPPPAEEGHRHSVRAPSPSSTIFTVCPGIVYGADESYLFSLRVRSRLPLKVDSRSFTFIRFHVGAVMNGLYAFPGACLYF